MNGSNRLCRLCFVAPFLILLTLTGACQKENADSNPVGKSNRDQKEFGKPTKDSDRYLIDEIKVKFSKPKYQFSVAEAKRGIVIEYQIQIENDIEDLIVLAQDAGNCDNPGPSGLIRFEKLHGNRQVYGIFDRGLCPPRTPVPTTVKKGTYDHQFQWDGRNWQGPSDTSNAKGAYFPVGVYRFEVSFAGNKTKEDGRSRFRDAYEVTVEIVK